MFGIIRARSRSLTKYLNNEYQSWCCNRIHNISYSYRSNFICSPTNTVNNFCTSHCFLQENAENTENFNPSKMIIKKDGSIKKKKKSTGVKVYILNEKGISSSMFLHEAEKLAEHQRLELKKVDSINGVAAYKLVTISDLLETEAKVMNSDQKKNEKLKKIIISESINPHDFEIKINNIKKFLSKGMKVFVKLGDRGSEASKLNALYGDLEKSLIDYSVNKIVSKSGYHVNITSKQKNIDTSTEGKKQ